MHLLIPFAHTLSEACQHSLQSLASTGSKMQNQPLPNLQALINRMQPLPLVTLGEASLSAPHERALADAWSIAGEDGLLPELTDGLLPWAALQASQSNLVGQSEGAWAFITPCHWSVQSQHISLDDPALLQLSEAESRAILGAMQAYFAQDGIALYYQTPTCWLAQGAVFADLPTASLDRVLGGGSVGGLGRNIQNWIPKEAAAKSLRRLQQEMQMLLYTHPLSDDRAARGLPAVNSFWISGTGRLPADKTALPDTTQPQGLREAALRDDGPAWLAAWKEVDASHCADLLRVVTQADDSSSGASLTLCGERAYQRFRPFPTRFDALLNGLKRKIHPLFPSHIISSL